MGGIALATLMERGEKKNMFESFARAAEDRGMSLPSADSGLMRLAAEGGPVLYRREAGHFLRSQAEKKSERNCKHL